MTSLAKPKPMVAGIAAREGTMDTPTTGQPPVPTTDHAAEERRRIQGILALPEAKGREKLAQALAFEPGIDTEAAKRILAAAAAEPTIQPDPANPLAAEMAKLKNPTVGAGEEEEQDGVAAEASRILAYVPAARRFKTA